MGEGVGVVGIDLGSLKKMVNGLLGLLGGLISEAEVVMSRGGVGVERESLL